MTLDMIPSAERIISGLVLEAVLMVVLYFQIRRLKKHLRERKK